MIDLKTEDEIKIMAHGGHILAEVLFALLDHIKPGVSELEVDRLAEKLIREAGADPGFQKVPGYKHAVCISTNDVVVHGVPTSYKFKEGDVVGIDCGVFYKGFHTDMSETRRVSSENRGQKTEDRKQRTENRDEVDLFLDTGKRALNAAIQVAKVENHIGDISKTIQEIVEEAGYSVVRSLIGHGVGRKLHEEPEVPGFLVGQISKTPKLLEGMTIAIEAIYNMGRYEVVYANHDGWTIKTKDHSISGLFERTVAVTKQGPVVLTK